MKTEVWLDTTALVDLEFRSAALRRHILNLFPQGCTPRTSRYVLFEFARSVMRRYLRLHNKAADLDALSSLTQYIGNCNVGSQRTASTMLGAYTDFLKFLEKESIALTPGQQLEHFRSWLAPHIRRGWKRASRLSTDNPIGCRDDLPAPQAIRADALHPAHEHMNQELPTQRCGEPDNCRLISSMRMSAGRFQAMNSALMALEQKDHETAARIPALQRLMSQDESGGFDRKDCYRCGDAIIAGEAPPRTTILSKNSNHFRPLCDAIHHPLVTYKEPAPAAVTPH